MSKILYEVYKNDIKDSESVMYGKWYARLKSIETMSMTKLAKHISEHGSVFTEDVVEGVMKKFKSCLLEMLSSAVWSGRKRMCRAFRCSLTLKSSSLSAPPFWHSAVR